MEFFPSSRQLSVEGITETYSESRNLQIGEKELVAGNKVMTEDGVRCAWVRRRLRTHVYNGCTVGSLVDSFTSVIICGVVSMTSHSTDQNKSKYKQVLSVSIKHLRVNRSKIYAIVNASNKSSLSERNNFNSFCFNYWSTPYQQVVTVKLNYIH